MKKFAVLGMALVLSGGIAFAASLSVPWYVDNAPAANKVPGVSNGVTGIVTLKSNRTDTLVVTITYFNSDGVNLGPAADQEGRDGGADGNTFTIAPLSALAFRPGRTDPDQTTPFPDGTPVTEGGGQEGAQGVAVPNRPDQIPGGGIDDKLNGSITLSWEGDPQDLQGQVAYFQTTRRTQIGTGATGPSTITMSYAHLLPPGV